MKVQLVPLTEFTKVVPLLYLLCVLSWFLFHGVPRKKKKVQRIGEGPAPQKNENNTDGMAYKIRKVATSILLYKL